jgi:hypothetical protein
LPINEFTASEAITKGRLNEIIRELNALEDASNLNARINNTGSYYSTNDDKILVQAVRKDIYDSTPDSWLGDVIFPKAFAGGPIVTATLLGGTGVNLGCYVYNVKNSQCTIRVFRTGTEGIPKSLSVAVIAIGPGLP